jgi:murein DD-endopeptidase MepM/ murein hydrolase activator NlpD
MPRVRQYEQNTVAPARTTNARFAAPDGGGAAAGLGAGLQRLGGALYDRAAVQDQIDQQLDDAGAKAIDNWLVPEAAKVRAQFLSQQGLNAGVARTSTEDALKKLRADAIARATTPRMKRMASEVADQRYAGWLGELDGHVADQTRKAVDVQTLGRIETSREEAIATTDPAARLANIATMNGEIDHRAATLGLGEDWAKTEKFKSESDVHASIATNLLIAEDIDGAVKYLDENKDRIAGNDETRLRAMLKDPLERRDTDAYVDRHMGIDTREGSSFSYSDPLHGAGTGVSDNFNEHKARGSAGVDFTGKVGTPIHPMGPGKVKQVSSDARSGNFVIIEHPDGTTSSYSHMNGAKVKAGDVVTPDTVLGGIGMTGRTSGPHVHVRVKKDGKDIDPQSVVGRVEQGPRRHDLSALLGAVDKDPNLTPEQRDRYKGEIERRVSRDEQLQARVEQDAERKALESVAGLGDGGFTSMDQLPANVRGSLSPSSRLQLMNMAEGNRRERARAAEAMNVYSAMTAGGANPFDERQRDAADAAFKAKGGTMQAALSVWQESGVLPRAGAIGLRGGLVSTDPAQVRAAANVAGNMLRRNPNAFAGVAGSEDIEKSALAFNHYVYDLGMPPQQAAQRVAQENTPEFKTKVKFGQAELDNYRRQVRKEGSAFAEQLIGGKFQNRVEAQEAETSYVEMTIENLRDGRDLATARSMAAAQLKKIYGASQFGTIRKYAAELAYPPLGGSHNYVYDDARKTVKAETGIDSKHVRLVPIPGVTDEDIRTGRPARYRILYQQEQNGQTIVNMVPGFFAADVGAAAKTESKKRRAAFDAQRAQTIRGQAAARSAPPLAIPTNPGAF